MEVEGAVLEGGDELVLGGCPARDLVQFEPEWAVVDVIGDAAGMGEELVDGDVVGGPCGITGEMGTDVVAGGKTARLFELQDGSGGKSLGDRSDHKLAVLAVFAVHVWPCPTVAVVEKDLLAFGNEDDSCETCLSFSHVQACLHPIDDGLGVSLSVKGSALQARQNQSSKQR